jgi:uncharacterized membrane protein YphA (DoxX/SURF4 family)
MDALMDVVVMLVRAGVGVILLISGLAKLRRRDDFFLEAILAYDLVPRPLAQALARLLPRLEVALGLALTLGFGVALTGTVSFALVLGFTSAVVLSLARGRRHFCGCLGFSGDQVKQVQWQIVYRNLVLLIGLLLVVTRGDPYRLDHSLEWTADGWMSGLRIALWTGIALAIGAIAAARLHLARLIRTTS